MIRRFDPFWCVLGCLTQFPMLLVQFITLFDTFLIKFLGKLLDEATEEFGWLMFKNKEKMELTNDLGISWSFFFFFNFSSFFPLMKML